MNISRNLLICPGCMEFLTQEDLEGFGACPYCNHVFKQDADLEDFLLQPVVQRWIAHLQAHAEDEGML